MEGYRFRFQVKGKGVEGLGVAFLADELAFGCALKVYGKSWMMFDRK